MRPDSGFTSSLILLVAILAVISSLQIGVSNYCFTNLRLNERTGFIIASVLFLIFIFSQNYSFFLTGLIVLIVTIAWQFKRITELRDLRRADK